MEPLLVAGNAALKWTKEECDRFIDIRNDFYTSRNMLVPRLGVICRMFLADDPKAELAKMVMELSEFLDPPMFETVKEYEDWRRGWHEKYFAIPDQDLLSVSTFLANRPCSSENQEN
jgi:hypothetical protein